jgi:sporulation protein YlmC with PRC-barrel domain
MNKPLWHLKPTAIVIASLFGLSLTAPVAAEGTSKQATTSASQASAGKDQRAAARQVRASLLIGKDVRNAQGEDLGDIKDIVVDMSTGRVHYVVLSFGGFLGVGDKLFAYPMRAFKPAADKDELILTVDREKLKSAPGFDKDRYPDWNAPDYRAQVDRYFGSTLTQPAGTSFRFARASELIGRDVDDPSGRDLGEIHDVVINLDNGDVRYAVLEFDQSWNLNNKLFAFPLRAFQVSARDRDDLMLNVSKDKLNNVPGFDKSAWPNLNINDPKFVTDVDRYLLATAAIPLPSATNDALWKRLDTNNDGALTQAEVKADSNVSGNWKSIDADSNGTISRSEFNASYRMDQGSRSAAGSK